MAGTPARAAHGSADSHRLVVDGDRDRIANFRMRPTTSASADPANAWARWIARDVGADQGSQDHRQGREQASRDETPAERPAHREQLDAERAQAFAEARASVGASRVRIAAALSILCAQCGASKDAYCYPAPRGFCRERWAKSLRLAAPALRPGDLEPLAQAQRNVTLHERQHERGVSRPVREATR